MRDVALVIQEMKVYSDALTSRVSEIMDRPVAFSSIMHERPEDEFDPDRHFEKQQKVLEIASRLAKNNMELKSLLMLLGANYDKIKD